MKSRLVIVLIFALACGLSGYAWWHNVQKGRKSLAFWGTDWAVLIRYAPQVLFLELEQSPDDGRSETLDIGDQKYTVARQVEISGVPGLVHARHALVEDASFLWSAEQPECVPDWQFALRFVRDNQRATVAFDPKCNQVSLVEQDRMTGLLDERMRAFDRKRHDWAATRAPASQRAGRSSKGK